MSFRHPSNSMLNLTLAPKKTRCRLKGCHRWTEEETRVLLTHVLEAVKNDPTSYERPTSQKFYRTNCQHKTLDGIAWTTMRAKMRYLKCTYFKALHWREQVGSELFQSDKSHVEARMRTICPFYDLLNAIFEPMLPADPIRLTDNDFKKYLPPSASIFKVTENDFSMDATEFDDDSGEDDNSMRNDCVSTKIEQESDERSEGYEETMSPKPNGTIAKQVPRMYFNETTTADHGNIDETFAFNKTKFQLENAKLAIERNRLSLDCQGRMDKKQLARLQLNLEKEKLEFEKQKLLEESRLRQYEIDKQFEIKKLELERDERLQRLELEYKYKYKVNDEK